MVPCRNEAGAIGEALDSILAQDLAGFTWEILIADGMSNDGTRAILERYRRDEPRVRVIDNPRRTVPAGLNAAIREARGEIILRMDAHTSYAPDYVRRSVETLRATGAANVGGPARTRPHGYWGRAIAAAYHSPLACGGARFHNPEYEGWADTVPYGCWRKSTLVEAGLFDEALVRNQDDELNLRLWRAGKRVWQSPAIVSWYRPRGSVRQLFQQYFQYGFWKVAVISQAPPAGLVAAPGTGGVCGGAGAAAVSVLEIVGSHGGMLPGSVRGRGRDGSGAARMEPAAGPPADVSGVSPCLWLRISNGAGSLRPASDLHQGHALNHLPVAAGLYRQSPDSSAGLSPVAPTNYGGGLLPEPGSTVHRRVNARRRHGAAGLSLLEDRGTKGGRGRRGHRAGRRLGTATISSCLTGRESG